MATYNPKFLSAIVIFLVVFVLGCGGDKSNEQPQKMDEEQTNVSDEDNASDAYDMSKMMGGDLFENKEPVPPVSFKVLMNYLPKEIDGMTMQKPRGETVQWQKWTHSNAEVRFSNEAGDQRGEVEIYDYAYISNLYLPYQMLFNMKFQRESSEGYEKSTELNGMPTFEKWSDENKDNEVTVLVAKRFIVQVRTDGMPEGSARKIAEGINLSGLANEKS